MSAHSAHEPYAYALGTQARIWGVRAAARAQNVFKQSDTRLHYIAEQIIRMTRDIFHDPHRMAPPPPLRACARARRCTAVFARMAGQALALWREASCRWELVAAPSLGRLLGPPLVLEQVPERRAGVRRDHVMGHRERTLPSRSDRKTGFACCRSHSYFKPTFSPDGHSVSRTGRG